MMLLISGSLGLIGILLRQTHYFSGLRSMTGAESGEKHFGLSSCWRKVMLVQAGLCRTKDVKKKGYCYIPKSGTWLGCSS